MALASFLQLIRPASLQQQRERSAYRAQVQDIATRVQALYNAWLALREHESDNFGLANAAAVHRWELMRLAKSAEHLEVPRSLTALHRDMHTAVLGSARACQLLANGYRGHKSEAVCDGQALLIDSVAEISGLLAQLEIRA